MAALTEGKHKCGACLQWVGTDDDGHGTTRVRPYTSFIGSDGRLHYHCDDRLACEQRYKDVDKFAASEAKSWFPEDEDEEE